MSINHRKKKLVFPWESSCSSYLHYQTNQWWLSLDLWVNYIHCKQLTAAFIGTIWQNVNKCELKQQQHKLRSLTVSQFKNPRSHTTRLLKEYVVWGWKLLFLWRLLTCSCWWLSWAINSYRFVFFSICSVTALPWTSPWMCDWHQNCL